MLQDDFGFSSSSVNEPEPILPLSELLEYKRGVTEKKNSKKDRQKQSDDTKENKDAANKKHDQSFDSDKVIDIYDVDEHKHILSEKHNIDKKV